MSSIRLLILGVLQRKQPAHGYEVRRELETWQADRWANIAYGSIYSALNKMAEEGLIEVVNNDRPRKPTARTEYILTDAGKKEFARLLREYWWEWKPLIDPFQIALTFMDYMPHDELLVALKKRANYLRAWLTDSEYLITIKSNIPGYPRHLGETIRLTTAHVEAELNWIEQAITKVEKGELP